MAANNPDITASDIITDVEVRLDSPGIATTDYVPWVSYAYQKTFAALIRGLGQQMKEDLFGSLATFNLTNGTAEYSLITNIPRFGGFIKVEVKYGATGDDWVVANRLGSLANWHNQNNVSTSYRAKTAAIYYKLGNLLGFIPTPPSTDSGTPQAKVWYVKRPYQITLGTDVIDIPYRFIYPIVNYVHAKAIEKQSEDYGTAQVIESKFQLELSEMVEFAASEDNENDGTSEIQVDSSSPLFDNPFSV